MINLESSSKVNFNADLREMSLQQKRKLDPYERFLWLPTGESAFNLCLAIGIDGKIKIKELKQAVRFLQQTHSI
jgi:hypothetical protein